MVPDYKKYISVILIFVILIQMPGCVSTKPVNSIAEIPSPDKYSYILHIQKTRYQIINANISNGIITGNLKIGEPTYVGHKVHFYLHTDSVLNVTPDMMLKLNVNSLSKVEVEHTAKGKTAALVGGIVLVVLTIVGIVVVHDLNYNGL